MLQMPRLPINLFCKCVETHSPFTFSDGNYQKLFRVTHEKIFLFELHSHNNFMGGRRMRPPGSLISGIISLFELIKSNTLSVDHWHYSSKLFSFNKNSLTPIVTYPLSSRRGFIVLSTIIIFLNESFALSKDFVS